MWRCVAVNCVCAFDSHWDMVSSSFTSYSLGQHFATIEAITIMSMLAQKFTFELVDPKIEPAYKPSLTLPMENGLPVRIKRRVDNA